MIITLTTDFGHRDSFVGAMKGVILTHAPQTQIVDLAHGIPAGDVQAGAFALMTAAPYFPPGAIHVVVIDPGVGGARKAVAIRAGRAVFLGPDNGVLSWALREESPSEIRSVENPEVILPRISVTFHGRDVFAPAAAWLARGGNFADLGGELDEFQNLEWPLPTPLAEGWQTEVVHVDVYGNAITSFPGDQATGLHSVMLPGELKIPLQPFYSAVREGSPLAVIGSSGFVEIAMNRGNAASALGLIPGTLVTIVP
jgi:S-adenosylmethionine hydrolase